jgi:hypothetical protein
MECGGGQMKVAGGRMREQEKGSVFGTLRPQSSISDLRLLEVNAPFALAALDLALLPRDARLQLRFPSPEIHFW